MIIRKLSIIIPVYNEADTIALLLHKVMDVVLPGGIKKEIIVIDDCSSDDTAAQVNQVQQLCSAQHIRYTRLKENKGKGFAVRTGIHIASGEVVVIQDADLEYDPNDYVCMIQPLLNDECKVVYGSRILNSRNSYSYHSFYWGGRLVSLATSLLFGQKITDEPTCYKMFEASLLKSIPLTSDRFGFCPEVTAKVLRRGITIKEVPIHYFPRTKQEGKKIRWSDGVEALFLLVKYRWADMEASDKPDNATDFRWAAKNILSLIVSLLLVAGLFRVYPAYHWVYADLLKKNMMQKKKYPDLTFDQKMQVKLGTDYQYLMYIRNATPENAVILYPSQEAFNKEGSPFKHDIGNKIYATRFLYPRRLVLENESETNRYAGQITHIAIVNGVVPGGITLPVDSISPHVILSVSPHSN